MRYYHKLDIDTIIHGCCGRVKQNPVIPDNSKHPALSKEHRPPSRRLKISHPTPWNFLQAGQILFPAAHPFPGALLFLPPSLFSRPRRKSNFCITPTQFLRSRTRKSRRHRSQNLPPPWGRVGRGYVSISRRLERPRAVKPFGGWPLWLRCGAWAAARHGCWLCACHGPGWSGSAVRMGGLVCYCRRPGWWIVRTPNGLADDQRTATQDTPASTSTAPEMPGQ